MSTPNTPAPLSFDDARAIKHALVLDAREEGQTALEHARSLIAAFLAVDAATGSAAKGRQEVPR